MNFSINQKQKIEHFYQNIGENWFSYADLYRVMIERYGDGSHFVEIGSWKGRSSAYMATEIHNSGKNIIFDCVDTFSGSQEHLDKNSGHFHPQLLEDPDWLYKEFLKNTEPVKHIINPIRASSLEAAKRYENESLDFIFIDASHTYQDVFDDMTDWFPKLKMGGMFAGHDINYHEVQKAVEDWMSIYDTQVYSDSRLDVWFVEKKK